MANEIARSLRKRMTPQEVKLWVRLRSLKPLGFRFRRQIPINKYIVDFVCFATRIIVETDGGQHGMQAHQAADRQRDNFLTAQGFSVMHFWNHDIDHNLDGVIETIASRRRPLPDRLTPVDPPRKGEG